MATFLIGLVILIGGGMLYGRFCEKLFGPDDRKTPAYTMEDGVDYVPMKTWKNSLINLLNIAGTGPILGPIQGILFGPIAFILIPIGNIIGGSMHDYFCGMISMRNDGAQMPTLIKKYTNKPIFNIYNVFVGLLLLLVGAVFIYTPGDIAATQVFGFSGSATAVSTWVIYGVIFVYYLIATLFPIDKIIGRIYPVFGLILVISAVGVFVGLFTKSFPLQNVAIANWKGIYPVNGTNLVPIFFVTVACGIVSGFHSTQNTIIARNVTHEKQGRMTFYNMMMLEGLIAMIWAAAAMGAINMGLGGVTVASIAGLEKGVGPVGLVGIICKTTLGKVGGIIALLGVIVLPVTSGDTALRGLRLLVAEYLHIDQKPAKNRLAISSVIFALVAVILIFAKINTNGFNILWRYFAWSNQTMSIFAFAMISMYLGERGKPWIVGLVPGLFYTFVTSCYIINAKIGFNVPLDYSYAIAAALTVAYGLVVVWATNRRRKSFLLTSEESKTVKQ
jgi:carbon starvation protein CstA